MGQAFMPRRGGSFVKHRHKYVARYEWVHTETEGGVVKSATCTRTLVCSCGKVEGEETVEATMKSIIGRVEEVSCWKVNCDRATATFSDGDSQTKDYNIDRTHTPVDSDGDGRCDICFGVI